MRWARRLLTGSVDELVCREAQFMFPKEVLPKLSRVHSQHQVQRPEPGMGLCCAAALSPTDNFI
jgi:hypothetical protein